MDLGKGVFVYPPPTKNCQNIKEPHVEAWKNYVLQAILVALHRQCGKSSYKIFTFEGMI